MNDWVLPAVVSFSLVLLGGMIFVSVNAEFKQRWMHPAHSMTLVSLSLEDNEIMPYACTRDKGASNWSPDLSWSNVPEETQSFVLTCEDPDAPRKEPFVHWLMYNISSELRSLPERIGRDVEVMMDSKIIGIQSINDFGEVGYDGPCPPIGHHPKNEDGYHHYIFTLYALKKPLNFDQNKKITRQDLLAAMKDLVLATGRLVGKYKR